jgi:hypothetical protein
MAKKLEFRFDRKLSFIPFIITLVAALAARTLQVVFLTDLNTGIYYNRSLLYDYPVMIIAVGMIITLFLLAFGSSEDKVIKSVIMINPMHQPVNTLKHNYGGVSGGVCLAAGGLIAAQLIMYLTSARNRSVELIAQGALPEEVPVLTGIGANDGAMYFFMVIGFLTFMIMGNNIFKENGITAGNCFFLLAIPVWKIIDAFSVVYLMQKETRILMLYSEKLYIIIADMCVAVFFFRLVRVFASMEDKHARIKLIFWGYAASLTTLVSVLPRFIAMFAVPFDRREMLVMPEISDIGLAAFALCVIPAFFSAFSYREMPKITYSQRNAQVALADTPPEKQVMDEMDFNNIDTSTLNGKN